MDSKARQEVSPSSTRRSAPRNPLRTRRGLAWLGEFLAKAFRRPAVALPATDGRLSFEALESRILLDATPSIPATQIDGSIDVAGETDRYGFTLSETVRVVFDSLTDNASMRWSLEGPRGAVVSDRGFNASDSYELSGNVALDLGAGDYTLSVDGVADTTGAYSFRLIDIAQAQELTLGTTVNGQLDPANETDAYRFSVAAGQRFFIDRFASAGDIYWRLIDPYGRTVVDRTHMNNDLGELTLTVDGSYTLLIEGRAYTAGAAAYSFNVALLDDPVPQPMALGAVVAGRIAQAGQRDIHSFVLAADTRVVFDSLTSDYNMLWSLSGPNGTVVADRRFQSSDSYELGGNNGLLLRAGSYTLTVDGEGDRIGDYAFRLLDLAAAQEIAVNATVTGTLGDAGASAAQTHHSPGAPLTDAGADNRALAVAGGNRYVAVADAASLRPAQLTVEAWVYKDPALPNWGGVLMKSSDSSWSDGYGLSNYTDGRIHFFVNNYSANEVSADLADNTWTHVAGTYDGSTLKLYVNGVLAASKDYVATINHSTQPLRIGAGAGGSYPWRGQIDEVRVWDVARSAQEIATHYQQGLQGNEAALAGYWRMNDAGSTFADSSALANDGTLTNPPARETRLYRFSAVAGESFFFDSQGLSGESVSLRLFDPKGGLVYGPQSFTSDVDVFTAADGGDYVLALEGGIFNANSSNFQFTVQRVVDSSAPLALDTRVDGNLDHPGQRRSYTFTLAAPAQLLFDSLTYNNNFNWSLVGPRGSEVAGRSFVYSDSAEYGGNPVLDLAAGAYTLTVDGTLDTTGAYAFRLLNLATASSGVAYDSEVSDTLSPGGMTRVYKFTATAGDQVVFDRVALNGGSPYWRLLDETGFQVFGPESFADRPVTGLRLGGTYYLLVEGRSWETDDVAYGFKLAYQGNVPVPALTGTAITLGATVTGTLSAAGEVDDYLLDLTGPTQLYFDSFAPNNDGSFQWSLVGPRGTEVADRSTYYSESYEFGSGNPVVDVPLAGRYQIRIHGAANTTGNYSFRVLKLADGTTVTPGTPVSSSLDPANETDVYRFTANAGDRVFFDRQTFSPAYSGWVSWRLLDPYGRQVWGPANFNDDVDVRTLEFAGVYTLLIEGRIWSTGSVARFDYGFNIQPVVDDPASALTIGETVNGNIADAGQQVAYTFSLADETLLYFDSLSNSNVAWTLRGPDGYLLSRNLQNSDSYELGQSNPLLRLAAGDYTLTLDGSADTTGDYSFRLVDVASEAAGLIAGTAVSDSLSSARVTDFYRLDVVAGERYYFDRISYGDYYNTTYRLIDPQGNQVWGGYVWPEDQEMNAFTLSGTYYLLVEGRVGNGAPANAYSFNMQRVVDISDSLTLGQAVSGSFGTPGQRASYRFTLAEARQLLFDGLSPNNANPDIYWTLTGPRGTEISNRRFYGSESYELGTASPLLDLVAGDYTLTLDPQGDQTGEFSFRMLDVAAATAFASNSVVSGQLDPANETDVYTFNATAGTRYAIDRQNLSGVGADWLTWRLFDPYGRQVFGPTSLNDVDVFTLGESGAYTLIVEGRIWDTQYSANVDYSFKLLEITDDFVDIVPGVSHGVDQFGSSGPIDGALNLDGLRYAQVADTGDLDLTGSRPDRLADSRSLVQGRRVCQHLAGAVLQGQRQQQPADLHAVAEFGGLPAPVDRQQRQQQHQHCRRQCRHRPVAPRRGGARPRQCDRCDDDLPRRRRGRQRRSVDDRCECQWQSAADRQ